MNTHCGTAQHSTVSRQRTQTQAITATATVSITVWSQRSAPELTCVAGPWPRHSLACRCRFEGPASSACAQRKQLGRRMRQRAKHAAGQRAAGSRCRHRHACCACRWHDCCCMASCCRHCHRHALRLSLCGTHRLHMHACTDTRARMLTYTPASTVYGLSGTQCVHACQPSIL